MPDDPPSSDKTMEVSDAGRRLTALNAPGKPFDRSPKAPLKAG